MYINFIGVGVVFIYWPVSPLVSIIAPSKGDLFITGEQYCEEGSAWIPNAALQWAEKV